MCRPYAERLEGLILKDRWQVVRRIKPNTESTGGFFSVSYVAKEVHTRKEYFLKAMDLSLAHSMGPSLVTAVEMLSSYFNHEVNLCIDLLTKNPAKRVIEAFDYGEELIDNTAIEGTVPWIIFEKGRFDIRNSTVNGLLSVAAASRVMHQVTLGTFQLHSRGIAHQDIKPSNVIDVGDFGVKVGDLGRAVLRDEASPFETLIIAGDHNYAPPELSYYNGAPYTEKRELIMDWEHARLSCDMYQIGALYVFLLSGMTLNALIDESLKVMGVANHRDNDHNLTLHPDSRELLQAHRMAIDTVIGQLDIDKSHIERISTILIALTEPNPEARGAPRFKTGHRPRFSLEPFVSGFDSIASRLERGLRGGVI